MKKSHKLENFSYFDFFLSFKFPLQSKIEQFESHTVINLPTEAAAEHLVLELIYYLPSFIILQLRCLFMESVN